MSRCSLAAKSRGRRRMFTTLFKTTTKLSSSFLRRSALRGRVRTRSSSGCKTRRSRRLRGTLVSVRGVALVGAWHGFGKLLTRVAYMHAEVFLINRHGDLVDHVRSGEQPWHANSTSVLVLVSAAANVLSPLSLSQLVRESCHLCHCLRDWVSPSALGGHLDEVLVEDALHDIPRHEEL